MSNLEGGGQKRNSQGTLVSQGFLLRAQAPVESSAERAVVARIPVEALATGDMEPSVCGLKAFLIDERLEFPSHEGDASKKVVIDCAKVAVLDIVDSPVHVHGETLETYHVLEGHGRMVLGEQVVDVGPGTYIVIPPDVRHGLTSADPIRPVRVLMTFTPGLAPVSQPSFRDELILHASTRTFIEEEPDLD